MHRNYSEVSFNSFFEALASRWVAGHLRPRSATQSPHNVLFTLTFRALFIQILHHAALERMKTSLNIFESSCPKFRARVPKSAHLAPSQE